MTYYDAYIGDLDDPDFDWEGNVPKRKSPFFPPLTGSSSNVYRRAIELIESGQLPGKQTDWGGWVAKASQEQILAIVDDWYSGDPWDESRSEMPHLFDQLQELRQYIELLEESKLYALVGTEL